LKKLNSKKKSADKRKSNLKKEKREEKRQKRKQRANKVHASRERYENRNNQTAISLRIEL
jgi:hypothetical protein